MSWKEPVYEATVESIERSCSAGHKVGDVFEINTHETGGICGYCYHDLFPTLMCICFGGKIPWHVAGLGGVHLQVPGQLQPRNFQGQEEVRIRHISFFYDDGFRHSINVHT